MTKTNTEAKVKWRYNTHIQRHTERANYLIFEATVNSKKVERK